MNKDLRNRPLRSKITPRILPEPQSITTARRNIHSPEFKQYLSKEFPTIQRVDDFINFFDRALENFGKGMAYVHWKHGAINPTISFGDMKGFKMNMNANEKSYERGNFPKVTTRHYKPKSRSDGNQDEDKDYRDKDKFPLTITDDLLSLSDHRSSENVDIAMSIGGIYAKFLKPNAIHPSHSVMGDSPSGISSVFPGLKTDDYFVALGAHESYHIYDAVYHSKQLDEELKTYNFSGKKGSNIAHPIELRAQKAARAAIDFYEGASPPRNSK